MAKPSIFNPLQHPVLTGIGIFLAALLLTQSLTYQQYLINKRAEEKDITDELHSIEDKLESTLSYSFGATKTLAFIVKQYGVPADFDSLARNILEVNPNIDALQLTRKGEITHVFPLRGNEASIGYDILADPRTRYEAEQAIERSNLFFAGPFELRQGGVGIVGRLPIFINNNFEGFAVVILKLSTLFERIGLVKDHPDYLYQFSKLNPSTGTEEFFLESPLNSLSPGVMYTTIPHGDWKLYVGPRNPTGFGKVTGFTILGILFSVMAGFYTYTLVKQPARLSELIAIKTKELQSTQKDYKATLERVSDAFVALDTKWRYTFMNERAGKIFNCDPEKMIGKHIWSEFPEGADHPFYQAYHKAMEEQQYIYLEEYYPSYGKWFENHIYPSPDGLSIYLKDVTDRKKAELELANERILSDFIINSLPGIFYLYDMNGKFIRWNKNFEVVSGYSAEEISKMSPLDFFDKSEQELLRKKIENVFVTGKDEVDAHFFTKQGKRIPYYFNGIRVTLNDQSYLIGVGLDITERVRSKEALMKRELYFRKIIENISDGIVLIDRVGNVSFQSPSVERITGYTLEELRQLPLGSLNHPSDREGEVAFFAKLVANPGSSMRKTYRLKRKDGQYIWIDGNYTNLLNEDGINSIAYVFSDITETKLAELALRASEAKYRFLFDNSPLPKWIFDIETLQIVEVNNAAIEHYGYSREEFLSMTIRDIRPEEDIAQLEQIDRNEPRTDTLLLGHWRHKKKNGEIIHVTLAGHEITYNEKRSMIVVSVDVTEQYLAQKQLNESHQRLVKLTNKVPAVIYELEADTSGWMKFEFLSKGIESIWPTLSAEELTNRPIKEFTIVHNEDVERFNQSILESYQNLSDWELEFRTNEKIGSAKWIRGSARPERKPDGTVIWYGYMQDITNLKKTEETLRDLNEDLRKQAEELAASNQELERFAYVASHDLQEPLRMVSSFLQLLEKKYNQQLDSQAQQYIYYAVDGAERMKQLILDLLAYSRLGTQAQPFESIDLNQTMDDVRASLKTLIDENRVVLDVETLPTVNAIGTQMFQLLQNLISNAIKYRKPDETPHIQIRSRENTIYWYIEVEDNGIGIDERFYEKIFVVFQRLHNRSEHSGTGIGLAICKKIVERHGGSIGVKSQPGKGSLFHFSLPKSRS